MHKQKKTRICSNSSICNTILRKTCTCLQQSYDHEEHLSVLLKYISCLKNIFKRFVKTLLKYINQTFITCLHETHICFLILKTRHKRKRVPLKLIDISIRQ